MNKNCAMNGKTASKNRALVGFDSTSADIRRLGVRSMTAPLLRAIQALQSQSPDRPVTVILPGLVDGRWWGHLMHANRERRLRTRLLHHAPNVVVASVPWQLQSARPEQAIAEEEPSHPLGAAAPLPLKRAR